MTLYVKKVLPNSNSCGNNDATTEEPTKMSLLSIEDGNPATSNVLYVNRCVWLQWAIGAYTGVQVGRGLAVRGVLSNVWYVNPCVWLQMAICAYWS